MQGSYSHGKYRMSCWDELLPGNWRTRGNDRESMLDRSLYFTSVFVINSSNDFEMVPHLKDYFV